MGRRRANSCQKSKEDLWKGAIELDIGDGHTVQLIGMDSAVHVVFARAVVGKGGKGGDGGKGGVSVSRVVRALVDEEYRHVVKDILEKGTHIELDSHPPAEQLLDLGAVWLINETAYTKGEDTHAHRLSRRDEDTVPNWTDETLRVHYVPDRFHMAHEVDWTKYCRGLLIGETVRATIAGEKMHVPMTGLPDSKDGVIVYKDDDLGFAVLNKPGGLPSHGTKSNHTENVTHMFSEALKQLWPENHRKIHVTLPYRVDTDVGGLVVVSTRKEFASYLNHSLGASTPPKEIASSYGKDHQAPGDNSSAEADSKKPDDKEDQPAGDNGGSDESGGAAAASVGDEAEADVGAAGAGADLKKRYRCLVCVRDMEGMDTIERLQQSGQVVTQYVDPKHYGARRKFVWNRPKAGGHEWLACHIQIVQVGDGNPRSLRAACVVQPEDGDNVHPDSVLAHRLWGAERAAPAEELGFGYVMQVEVELAGTSAKMEERTRQVRGQLAAMGCPIVGDSVYGGGTCVVGGHGHIWKRMALQCCEVSFVEPRWEKQQGASADGEKGGAHGVMVPSERQCHFRVDNAWWTPYLDHYNQSV
eukprot:CAMPEP_0197438514 /NCGR_PEP_ID=MMETSP1175-20131217/5492_1 /TAXON_ID=1003142 /ORGANISM="Triceratium dubium, Strain CCMP147" /LENGTH=584 /DNA_ID=CAMNT_0042968263 /DNA_START=87 /DNA_END=1841 /DNA_ORIENTATION=+